jgi:hypothetical protein
MAGAGWGHAAVLSAGMGWEARRAAGLGVRPETAAEATGRPPGFHWGRFGAAHTLEALKLRGTGEWLSIHPGRGGLGLAIHCWPSMHCGAESDMALAGGVAGWEQPWRCGLPKLLSLESGVAHTQTVARWELPYTGGSQRCVVRGSCCVASTVFLGAHSFNCCRTSYPTLPLFSVFRKLILPSDIFEVKIWMVFENDPACFPVLGRKCRFRGSSGNPARVVEIGRKAFSPICPPCSMY